MIEKVIKEKYSFVWKNEVITEVEKASFLLEHIKKEKRTLVVPGDIKDLPDELPGGFIKAYSTGNEVVFVHSEDGPGIQMESDIFYDNHTNSLFNTIYQKICYLHNEHTMEHDHPKYQQGWFFINPPTEENSNYHDHKHFNDRFPHNVPSYTWTYYLQLPDNCEGEEGYLSFKEGDKEDSIKVEEDTIYIFPSDLLHRPNISPNSTKNRITAAGNILIPTSEKSLFV